MRASRYCFCGIPKTRCHVDGHVCRHGIAHPAAQGQQDDHDDEYQKAHEAMIVDVEKSSTVFGDVDAICYIFNSIIRL